MTDEVFKNKKLKARLNNIGLKDWIKVARDHNLFIAHGTRGSHYTTIRDPKNSNRDDVRGVITTITPNCYLQNNIKIFKRFLAYGLEEDEIWKSLGLKK